MAFKRRRPYLFNPPEALYEEIARYVEHSYVPSINQFIIEACRDKLRKVRR